MRQVPEMTWLKTSSWSSPLSPPISSWRWAIGGKCVYGLLVGSFLYSLPNNLLFLTGYSITARVFPELFGGTCVVFQPSSSRPRLVGSAIRWWCRERVGLASEGAPRQCLHDLVDTSRGGVHLFTQTAGMQWCNGWRSSSRMTALIPWFSSNDRLAFSHFLFTSILCH